MLSIHRAITMLAILVPVLLGSNNLALAVDPTSAAPAQSAAPASTGTSCQAVNCQLKCNPACSSDMVCSLTTMNQCAVCPVPVCVSKNLGTSSDSSSSSGSNAGLLPGLVGGLVGLLVIALVAFGIIRYKRRKAQGLPFWKSGDSHSETSEHWNRPGTQSAVVPIAYMPPSSHHTRTEMQSASLGMQSASLGTGASLRNSLALSNQNDYLQHPSTPNSYTSRYSSRSENPFADLDDESTVQLKRVVTLRKMDSVSRGGNQTPPEDDDDDQSVASSVMNAVTRNDSVSAVQMQRAKPTLMRINTIKVEDGTGGMKRSGSVRTILTPESGSVTSSRSNSTKQTSNESDTAPSQSSLTAQQAKQERPVSVVTSGSHRTNVTDSVMSAPGDGEITIFWDGNGGSSRNHSD
ncbi:hypothetical protein K450DRAFT_253741 [Umbelopsis ramanniana AG]|uniref:Membrane anchor Opy2 N-terminal domain-containing protein n=1 Tax=Umbelopsis ramanniana AG TaxID=1314678 RepID=A0AAD5E4P0_UMBRA|nr:uncharacterized protein K450DRAFT_253741 [Umbelopsis ramanniana AG]KAI8577118.1 hypothetical protein K450DRAFT_253741 [Umbelopsis ramanniana AG]